MTTTTSATTSTYLSVTLSPHLQSELSKPGVWAYEAYFSSTSATPTWTELVSSGAVMNGGTVSAKLTDDINGGKAYFIIESQSASQPANIESLITQQSDLNWTNAQQYDFAYDSFEFTLSGGTADQGNLSSVNGFALPMGVVVDYDSGTASATSATVGYAVSGAAIVSAIQNIDSSTMASAIYNYTSGALAGDFRMALSPTEAVALNPQPPIPAFATTDWTSYVTALENVLSFKPPKTPPTIEFSGQFNGAATTDGIWHNSGYFAYQLSWNGTDFLLDPLPTSQIKGEIEIDPADLENSIYATQGSATIVDPTGQTPSFTIGTGVNNQWGTVIRELLTGFTGGFYLQTGKSPNGQVVDLNQNLNWDPTYAFQAQATYQTYDPYSQVFYFNSNSYGSGYSDSLMSQYTVGGPLINLYDPGLGANVKNIDITIYADGDQPSGYTPTSINNYITPPSGSYATPDPNENGSNITLSFFSSVPPNAGIVIASTDTITLNILVPQQNGPPTWSAVTFDGSPSSAGPLGLWQTWQINYDATSNSYSAVPQSPPTQQIAGYMLIDGFPVADSAGSVSWYQLVVGDKTYNLYTTASGGQFENPNYSGQQKALAIDGLATITPEASSAPTIATFNVNFAVGDTVTYDPSLVVLNTANVSSQTMPDAPVAGTILPTGGFPLGAFDALPGQTSATSNTITTSETNLVFAWTGENNNSNTVSWVGAYTNKIDAGQTAVVTITSGTSTTTTSATADIDGRWQTSDTVTLNPGTYTITMAEQLSGSTVAFTPTSDPLILTEIAPDKVVSAGSVSSGAAVSGLFEVRSGGTAVGTSVLGGGTMRVDGGGLASHTTVSGGGKEVVSSGGTASGTIVSGGGVENLFGSETSATIFSGGVQTIVSGGTAVATAVLTGGTEVVGTGATARGTIVSSAGEIDAGSAVRASLLGGSWMSVASGGVASGTTVSQSVLFVSGTASATQLTTGTEIVSSGGVDIGAHINSAGFELVSSGGVASSAIISGGTLEVASGGSTGSGAVTFAVSGGGILQLDDSHHFNGLVAGFGQPDLLALTDLSFVSGATGALWSQTTVSSGTLAVTNGATMVDITLLGQYAPGNFNVASATGGGTVVSDPPLATQTDPPPGTLVSPH